MKKTMKVFKQYKYKDCPIIIRQLDKWRFEYLLIYKEQFYGTFIKNQLKWYQWYRVFCKELATNKEINGMVHFLSKAAETTVETLLERDKPKKKSTNKRDSKK